MDVKERLPWAGKLPLSPQLCTVSTLREVITSTLRRKLLSMDEPCKNNCSRLFNLRNSKNNNESFRGMKFNCMYKNKMLSNKFFHLLLKMTNLSVGSCNFCGCAYKLFIRKIHGGVFMD